MKQDPYEPRLQRVPAASTTRMNAGRRWFNQVVMQYARPLWPDKPAWVHLPDRVWHRQSALLVSLYERKRHH